MTNINPSSSSSSSQPQKLFFSEEQSRAMRLFYKTVNPERQKDAQADFLDIDTLFDTIKATQGKDAQHLNKKALQSALELIGIWQEKPLSKPQASEEKSSDFRLSKGYDVTDFFSDDE